MFQWSVKSLCSKRYLSFNVKSNGSIHWVADIFLSAMLLWKTTFKIVLPVKGPSLNVGEGTRSLWHRKGLLTRLQEQGWPRPSVGMSPLLPPPVQEPVSNERHNKNSPSGLKKGCNSLGHEQQLNSCQTSCLHELQHVAQLLPAIIQLLGASLPCGILFALLWDAGLPTGWRTAAPRKHLASSCWEAGCLPVRQFFWLWNGRNQGENRKEKNPNKTVKLNTNISGGENGERCLRWKYRQL